MFFFHVVSQKESHAFQNVVYKLNYILLETRFQAAVLEQKKI